MLSGRSDGGQGRGRENLNCNGQSRRRPTRQLEWYETQFDLTSSEDQFCLSSKEKKEEGWVNLRISGNYFLSWFEG